MNDHHKEKIMKHVIAVGMLTTLLFLGLVGCLNTPAQVARIHEPFSSAYESNKAALGQPLFAAELTNNSYIARHQNAIALWTKDPIKTWAILKNSGTWFAADDPYPFDKPTYFNDECNSKRFDTPKGSSPPDGGLAVLWENDPKKYRWMGWREWHCQHAGITHQQVFEHGRIVGPFTGAANFAFVFVLMNNSAWRLDATLPISEAPACVVSKEVGVTGPCPVKIDSTSKTSATKQGEEQ